MVTLKDNDAKEKETVLKDDASIYQKREEKNRRLWREFEEAVRKKEDDERRSDYE